jgi:hypothetical protein
MRSCPGRLGMFTAFPGYALTPVITGDRCEGRAGRHLLTGQVRIGLLNASDRDAVIDEGLGVGQLMVMTAPGMAGRTGR